MISSTPTPGGMPSRRLSAKQSGFSLPSLKVRMVSCISWLLPYSGDRSRYEDVLDRFMSRWSVQNRSAAVSEYNSQYLGAQNLPWMMMLAQYQRTLDTLFGCFLYSVRFMTES